MLITIGLVFFLGQINSEWHYALRISRLWPVILLVMGLGRMLLPEGDPAKGETRASGIWMIVIGVLFLLNNYRVLTLGKSWPLFIVLAGLSIMFSRSKPVAAADAPRRENVELP